MNTMNFIAKKTKRIGRVAEPLHDAFLSRRRLPKHISYRGGGGPDHVDWWLEDGVDSIVQNQGHL